MKAKALEDLLSDAESILWHTDSEQLAERYVRIKLHKNQVEEPEFISALLIKAARHLYESGDILNLIKTFIC